MTGANVVYVYDANPVDLRGRLAQLRSQLAEAGAGAAWEVRGTSSRNSLLVSIAADVDEPDTELSVSLIDLRAETGDLDQLGFRICETIVRHPALKRSTRPLVWTDRHTAANLSYARSVGAAAIIDDAWVDRDEEAPLAEVLDWAACRPPVPTAAVGADTRVFPQTPRSLEDEDERRRQLFRRWFGINPEPVHFAILWGIADAVEFTFLDSYLADSGLASSERAARRQRERLQAAMTPMVESLDGPNPARAEVARRFLAEAAPPEPSRLPELSWPMLEHVRELVLGGDDAVRWSFVADDGLGLLRRFLIHLDPLPAGRRTNAARAHARIEEAAGEALAELGLPRGGGTELLRSAAHAIDDAHADWRDHGEPQRLRGEPATD